MSALRMKRVAGCPWLCAPILYAGDSGDVAVGSDDQAAVVDALCARARTIFRKIEFETHNLSLDRSIWFYLTHLTMDESVQLKLFGHQSWMRRWSSSVSRISAVLDAP
jgi:hypothetical protein